MNFKLLISLLISFFFAACGTATLPPGDAARQFFELCKSGQIQQAYASTSASFKMSRSVKYFDARVHDLRLDLAEVSEIEVLGERGGVTRLRAVLVSQEGAKLVFNLGLILEDGQYRLLEVIAETKKNGRKEDVFAVEVRSQDIADERSKAFLEPVSVVAPSERQGEQLVKHTIQSFAMAIKEGKFSAFYNEASDRWKYRGKNLQKIASQNLPSVSSIKDDINNQSERLTESALATTFDSFVKAKVDFSAIQNAKLLLKNRPRVDSDGILVLEGTFDTFVFIAGFPPKPRNVHFKLEYVFEISQWKLYGIVVDLIPPKQENAAVR